MQNWKVYSLTVLPNLDYTFFFRLAIALICISGCALPPQSPHNDSIVINADWNALWLRCQLELKDRGFRLDRVDARAGVIETYPLISRQWFEFWHKDVVDRQSLMESSLHSIRRQVHMELKSLGKDKFRLRCRVNVQRLSSPPTLVSGTVWAENVFFDAAGRIPTWSESSSMQDRRQEWINLGNDNMLETQIFNSIQKWQKNTF